jgi:hypothetical protein
VLEYLRKTYVHCTQKTEFFYDNGQCTEMRPLFTN